jgi:hypothetical protein
MNHLLVMYDIKSGYYHWSKNIQVVFDPPQLRSGEG